MASLAILLAAPPGAAQRTPAARPNPKPLWQRYPLTPARTQPAPLPPTTPAQRPAAPLAALPHAGGKHHSSGTEFGLIAALAGALLLVVIVSVALRRWLARKRGAAAAKPTSGWSRSASPPVVDPPVPPTPAEPELPTKPEPQGMPWSHIPPAHNGRAPEPVSPPPTAAPPTAAPNPGRRAAPEPRSTPRPPAAPKPVIRPRSVPASATPATPVPARRTPRPPRSPAPRPTTARRRPDAPARMPAQPFPADAATIDCEIIWVRVKGRSEFHAIAPTAEGKAIVARSPSFQWRLPLSPDATPGAAAAHQALVRQLLAAGWQPCGRAGVLHWYADRFQALASKPIEQLPAAAPPVVCEIKWVKFKARSEFHAIARTPEGEALVARSPSFRWWLPVSPDATPAAAAAHQTLVRQLLAAGWAPCDGGGLLHWYGQRFRSPEPSAGQPGMGIDA